MNSPSSPIPPSDATAPFDEHPDDPDRDFDEKNEDYLDYIIAKLQKARTETQDAELQAANAIENAQQQEHALWLSYGSYLSGVAKWRHEKTGSGDIRKPRGTLLWVEELGEVEITDNVELRFWVRTQLQALLELAAALPLIDGHSSNQHSALAPHPKESLTHSHTPEPQEIARPPATAQESSLRRAVQLFYQTTQLLPAGCRIGPPRHVIRLEESSPQ